MRKNVFGRQFKRDTNERKALFKGLISSLIINGKIKTTEEKAKAIKADTDKIITHAKKGEIARRILQSYLLQDAVNKVILEVGPRFANRLGGYSRITRIGRRLSDNASMVLMEWVDNETQISNVKTQNLDGVEELKIKEDKKDREQMKNKQTKKTKRVSKKEDKT